MDKGDVVSLIIQKLKSDLETYFRAANSARFEATDSENKPESKYDTRGIEASYLAHGQSRQALQTKEDMDAFENLKLAAFSPEDPVDVGALVEVKSGRFIFYYFLGPSAGGTEVELDGEEVMVVTGQSPLGAAMMGARVGEKFKVSLEGAINHYTILSIS